VGVEVESTSITTAVATKVAGVAEDAVTAVAHKSLPEMIMPPAGPARTLKEHCTPLPI